MCGVVERVGERSVAGGGRWDVMRKTVSFLSCSVTLSSLARPGPAAGHQGRHAPLLPRLGVRVMVRNAPVAELYPPA